MKKLSILVVSLLTVLLFSCEKIEDVCWECHANHLDGWGSIEQTFCGEDVDVWELENKRRNSNYENWKCRKK